MTSDSGDLYENDIPQSEVTSNLSELNSEFARQSTLSTQSSQHALSTTPSETSTKRKRTQTAKTTWEHARPAKVGELIRDRHGNRMWYCSYCVTPWCSGSLTSVRVHLANPHQIVITPEPRRQKTARDARIDDVLRRAQAAADKRQDDKETAILKSVINKQALSEALVQLIVIHNLPHTAVEWPELQAVLMTVNYMVEDVLPASRACIPGLIDGSYICSKQLLRQRILASISLIHLSADLWTSPNRMSFVAVVAHFVDEKRILRKALLALPRVIGGHDGARQAVLVNRVIDEYGFAYRLGYFTGDNHGSNDTMCHAISTHLRDYHNAKWEAYPHRIRCQGHVLNIAVQAFLFAPDKKAIDDAIDVADDEINEQVEDNLAARHKKNTAAGWRKIGAMGKIHNSVIYMRSSELLTTSFKDLAGRQIPLDNDTRWNSWYKMLDVILAKKAPFKLWQEKHYRGLADDVLTPEDWETLEMTHAFLQPFYRVTQETQSDLDSIEKTLHTMNILFKHLERSMVS